MQTSRTRIMALSGATLALIVAGTAAVSAHPGDRGDRGDRGGFGRGGFGGFGGFERGGLFGLRDDLRMGIAGQLDQFVRRETTVETDDGLVTQRVDNGTATATGEASLDYSLASGETASVVTDDETEVVAFSEQTVELGRRGIARQRLVGELIELGDVAAGSEIVVWSGSQADGSFLAQRIVVRPVADATEAASTDDESAGEGESTSEDATTGTVSDA